MKADIKQTVVVTLEMSEREARWLRAVMQNPFTSDESGTDSEMRGKFFHAIVLPTQTDRTELPE